MARFPVRDLTQKVEDLISLNPKHMVHVTPETYDSVD